MTGGPCYEVRLGRKDGLVSQTSQVEGNSRANQTIDQMIAKFASKNFTIQEMVRSLGILAADSALIADPRTKPFVEKYAEDSNVFFDDFGKAMEKLSVYGVKTGHKGEVKEDVT
ncbi:unnamed protein product [Fraxinus pennsylvanica]|uniref:peroxidase n=1 Tax=Fraxinus pennsylvanica TaxID=56036 RepID=A0AAD2DKX4_9LAMI|nr:unnamed protein product [Fraxinus pennsylvanica]